MAMIDPEQEKHRLSQVYSSQTDEELESIAAQPYELTEVAREALRAELTKRGLEGQFEKSRPGLEEAEFRSLVTIRTFWYLAEAELAKSLLEAEGIKCFLFDENVVGLGWYANAVGGVKLRVDAGKAEDANRILEDMVSGDVAPDVDSAG